MILSNTLSFFSNSFDFFTKFKYFKKQGQFWLFEADVGEYHTHYLSCYHTFKGVLCRFQRTTIISSLLHQLYIFIEISTYLHDFQRATIKFFKKEY